MSSALRGSQSFFRVLIAAFYFISLQGQAQQISQKDLELSAVQLPAGMSPQSVHDAIKGTTGKSPRVNQPGRTKAPGWTITVDTRDQDSCYKVYQEVQAYQNLSGQQLTAEEACHFDPENPSVSFFVFQGPYNPEYVKQLNEGPLLSTEKNLQTDTRNLAIAMVATMVFLWYLPESASGWNKDEIRRSNGVTGLYFENIKNGPVMDKDDAFFNWVAHPIAGSAYYVMARHAGLTAMESFGYSVAMSTFFWEYGFEAVAEIPSIQDLIITPVIGSLLGHLLYELELSIDANGGKFLGSRGLGKVAKVIINPMGSLSNAMNSFFGRKVIQDAKAEIYIRNTDHGPWVRESQRTLGVRLKFVW